VFIPMCVTLLKTTETV